MSYVRCHWAYLTAAGRYPGIDLLRAAAVTMVILYHFGFALPFGWLGVDLFFAISGFLIGGMIIDDLDRGQWSFATFYRNRFLRILPTYYFIVIITVVVVVVPASGRPGVAGISTIAADFVFFQTTGDYFFGWHFVDAYIPVGTWSLVVEEYFYLLAPAFIAVAYMRKNALMLLSALAALAVVFIAVRIHVMSQFAADDPNWNWAASARFHCRVDELVCGVIAALIVRKWPHLTAKPILLMAGLTILSIPIGFQWLHAWNNETLLARNLMWAPAAGAFAFAMLCLALHQFDLKNVAVTAIARLSFPLYLGHIFVLEALGSHGISLPTFILTTLLFAYLVSLCVEYPFIRLYKRPIAMIKTRTAISAA